MRAGRRCALLLLALLGCGVRHASDGGAAPADAATGGAGDLAGTVTHSDFPGDPIVVAGAPGNAPALFAGGGAPSGGPCLLEPQAGALFPRNWLRPRFRFVPAAGQNLFELRLHAAAEASDLVVYTKDTVWTMPRDLWNALASHAADAPIAMRVRGAVLVGDHLAGPPARGSEGTFTIAPAQAGGSIVYWTTTAGTAFKGFSVGDETVKPVLAAADAQSKCVGCHSSTPDGAYVAFSTTQDAGNGDPATIGFRSVDGKLAEPPFLTAAARTLLDRVGQELPVFSRAHWMDHDHVVVTSLPAAGKRRFDLAWTDLEATSTAEGKGWGVLARTGDPGAAAGGATFSHDGKRIVYMSAAELGAGISAETSAADLRVIPYGARQGGASTALAGAADPAWNEYYPSLSPDDRFVAFSRVPVGQSSYDAPASEVLVVPSTGGQATRIAGNDPPACAGQTSPGVTNSWPKWAPEAETIGSRTFYWITFSSKRGTGSRPQLYVAGVVVEQGEVMATVRSYPALYLWNQPAAEGNHTPAWDVFQLPVQ